jgi:hypothetical protein
MTTRCESVYKEIFIFVDSEILVYFVLHLEVY